MNSPYEIVRTADGSDTVRYIPDDVTFHSVHGAIQESLHVFIKHGLEALPKTKKSIHIFEMGLGTGLNALLALQFGQEHQLVIKYTAVEKFPLPSAITNNLNYSETLNISKEVLQKIHQEDSKSQNLDDRFILDRHETDIVNYHHQATYDLVFFDAFGPGHQPTLWQKSILDSFYHHMNTGGFLVTFCAQGAFKRTLKEIGFEVEALPGPPGKREMTRAIKK